MADETAAHRPGNSPTAGVNNHSTPQTALWSGAPAAMPARLGRYRFKQRLGGGGMGAVYLVENTELQRDEALKVPHFESGNDPTVRERFLREARAAARLEHANLCPVYDSGVIDGTYYLTMRYLPGKLLATYTGRAYAPTDAVKLIAKLAQALQYAHGKGVIHRDLKPSNIMMCPGTGPTVMDFGLAKQTLMQDTKLTQTGMAMGTPAYMPPEQVKGELHRIGPASDVYSLGVILFELLTGRLPFDGKGTEVMAKVLLAPNPLPSEFRPGLDRAVDLVCSKAMAKEVEGRYPSMKEFGAALQELLQTLSAKDQTVANATSVRGKNPSNVLNEPTAIPEPPPFPELPPADRAKRRKSVSARRDANARASRRRSPLVIWLGLVLLLGGAVAVVGLLLLSSGNNPDKIAGKDFTNDVGIEMVRIPGGKFTMGSPKGEAGRDDKNEDEHPVEISSFHLGAREVTQKQYAAVMGNNPSWFSKNGGGRDKVMGKNTDDFPVENVSWNEAVQFCKALTARDKKKPAGYVYRLPREAEWEYACRGGVPSRAFYFGTSLLSTQANFNHIGELAYPYKVGTYEKNGFGLYDMHGNVWEWCHDWYKADYYGKSPPKDPPGPLVDSERVNRGGSWGSDSSYCRSAHRSSNPPDHRSNRLGFRVALVASR